MSGLTTYETEQPWVVYDYLTTDRRMRITGRSRIRCTCAICGQHEVLSLRIPRFAAIAEQGKHPQRIRFLLAHIHADRPHPLSWSMPLLNPAAHPGGIDLDLLAMRLQADLEASA